MRKFYSNKIKKRLRERALFTATGFLILSLAGEVKEARAQENLIYEITKIVVTDPNVNFSKATHINEDEGVVGKYGWRDSRPSYPYSWEKSFFYKNGIVRDLGLGAGDPLYSSNPSINDLGDIVVPYSRALKSFVYKIGEEPIEIAFLGEEINNKDEVVGGNGIRIYLYSEGKTTELFLSGDGIVANAINEHTQVVGSIYGIIGVPHVFLWDKGVITILNPYQSGAAFDINNKSQIVGYFRSGYPDNYACIWEKDAENKWVVKQLDTAVNSVAYAINDKGQIVGSINQQATLYEIKDGELIKINLNDFLPESSEWERLVCALDINDKGQIVGYGEGRNEPGSQYAFLMTPKPQPSADLTGDGIVNLYDLAEFASQWLESNQQ